MLDFTPDIFSSFAPILSSKQQNNNFLNYCLKYYYWLLFNKKGFRKAYCIMKSTTSHLNKKNRQKLIKVLAWFQISANKRMPFVLRSRACTSGKACWEKMLPRPQRLALDWPLGMGPREGQNGAPRSITPGNEVDEPLYSPRPFSFWARASCVPRVCGEKTYFLQLFTSKTDIKTQQLPRWELHGCW